MADLVGQQFGRYKIESKIGQGGMGAVYSAIDTRLARRVAIKVINPGQDSSDVFLKRFEREAMALAQLSHPNIVTVLDYGEQDCLPYLVMEFLPGGTLVQRLQKPVPYAEAARLLAPVTRALDYAHVHKIIHRDVKPANILFSEMGIPKLTDFGIVKLVATESSPNTLTGAGVGMGTPEYMAPEQATGSSIDHRVDIYALGIMFYELVTGKVPFQGNTPISTALMHITEPLPNPRQAMPGLPEAVEMVLYKALEKDPARRFERANDMAQALEALAQSPSLPYRPAPPIEIITPPPSAAPPPQRPLTPPPAQLSAAGSSQPPGPAGAPPAKPAPIPTVYYPSAAAPVQPAPVYPPRQTPPPQSGGPLTPPPPYMPALAAPSPSYAPMPPQPAPVLASQPRSALRPWMLAVLAGAGILCLLAVLGGFVILPSILKGQGVTGLLPATTAISSSVTRPPGSSSGISTPVDIAPATQDATFLTSANVANMQELHRSSGCPAQDMAYSPDGSHLAVVCSSLIYIYETQTWTEVRRLYNISVVSSVAFSPDGNVIAAGVLDHKLRLWSVADGSQLLNIDKHQDSLNSVAYSSKGDRLASSSADKTVRLWNPVDGSAIAMLDYRQPVGIVAFSPDGQYLATGADDSRVRLWNASDGSLLKEMLGHTNWVRSLAFSPDGAHLASGSGDGSARLWNVPNGDLVRTFSSSSDPVLEVSFSPDGALLATTSSAYKVDIWNVADGALLLSIPGPREGIARALFSPDGHHLAIVCADYTLRIWGLP